jgi:ABC-type branched-subunit amino acid transport system ATPase component/ABC-type branched-subunit amino acid transport system permease subunit
MTMRSLGSGQMQFLLAALVILLPLLGGPYAVHLATLIAAYWTLIAGLNLVVGFTGQLSVGHVGLLAVGAYMFAILTARGIVGPEAALVSAGVTGGLCGLLLGLPSLRLPGFYFAMTTLAFTIIVVELAVALTDVTGGGTGVTVSAFSPPMDTQQGQYLFTAGIAGAVTLMTVLVTRSMWGRAMVSVRESEVMAASVGIPGYRVKLAVFTFSGVVAGIAGALFGALQTYITPDTFAFDLSLFFFICIIIGGKGSIIGPFIGTVVLTLLPEVVSPLAKYSHLFYGVLLLAVVLLIPGGVGALIAGPRGAKANDAGSGGGFESDLAQVRQAFGLGRPRDDLAAAAAGQSMTQSMASARTLNGLDTTLHGPGRSAMRTMLDGSAASLRLPHPVAAGGGLEAVGVSRSFQAVKALQDVSLTVERGTVHGLIGPNGSGKTTLLNILSGYYAVDSGSVMLDGHDITRSPANWRPRHGIGRTFQTPRVIPELTVLDNVMAGGWSEAQATFVEALVSAPRAIRDERKLRATALALLGGLGLRALAEQPANAMTHAELRFVEIARALMHSPGFILLDEPASGLTDTEIDRLGEVIGALRRQGVGVLLVEHHTDLVFGSSDVVTTLNFGRIIRAGTPDEVRADPEVRSVYLGE